MFEAVTYNKGEIWHGETHSISEQLNQLCMVKFLVKFPDSFTVLGTEIEPLLLNRSQIQDGSFVKETWKV